MSLAGQALIRIAVVGDSNTEAAQVPVDQSYCSVLEHELNRRLADSGTRAEVLNFGVGGYGPAQEYLVIEKEIWRFDPQIVIMPNSTEISVLRSTRNLYLGEEDAVNPFFVLQNGRLTDDPETLRERAAFHPRGAVMQAINNLSNQIRLFALLRAGMQEAKKHAADLRLGSSASAVSTEPKGAFANLGPLAKVPRVQQALAKPDLAEADPDVFQAWRTTQAIILQARDTVAAHKAQFWLFTLDLAVQADPDQTVRAAFLQRLGVPCLFGVDQRLAEFLAHHGIAHAVLGPDIALYAQQHQVALHGFPLTPRNSGHWNENGHRVVGQLMAQKLLAGCSLLRSNATTD